MARERSYQERDVDRGIVLFARARGQNLEALRKLSRADWKRSGSQEGVGCVSLDDISRMMAEHDRSHGTDIAALIAEIRGGAAEALPFRSAVA